MQIGENIRKYRKAKNMTQEEMAKRLGGENGVSYPDITLLAPVARLLDISLDTLLSFQGELTQEEMKNIIAEVDDKLKFGSYEESFKMAQKILQKYPNCDQLTWQLAMILDAHRMFREIPDAEVYDSFILECYTRALKSRKEEIRCSAAESLYNLYLRREQYEKAEEYLQYFSDRDPEKKRKQAVLYEKTGRFKEAYRIYEGLILSGYQMGSMVLHGLYLLALKEDDTEKARWIVRKQASLAACYEMGAYYEVLPGMDLAVMEKNKEEVLSIASRMLKSIEEMQAFKNSRLYEHLEFQKCSEEFIGRMRENLRKYFKDESFDFMQTDERWRKLLV